MRQTKATAAQSMRTIRNPISRLVVMVFVALLFLAAAACVINLKLLYDDAILSARKATQNLARAFGEHTARTFEAVDRAVIAVAALHREDPSHAGTAESRHRALSNIRNLSDVLQSLGLTNASGDLIASSAFIHPPRLNVSQVDHFSVHAGRSDAGLYVGKPFTTRLSNAWVVSVSRRLTAADGGFAGTAVGLVDLSYFQRLYNSMTLGSTQTIGLLHRDGHVVMLVPQFGEAIGSSLAPSPLFRIHLPQKAEGTFITVGRFDRQERIISYSSVRNYPLVVTIGMTKTEALAGWYRQLSLTVAASVISLLLFMALSGLLIHRLERDEQRRREIETARADAVTANRAKSDFLSNMSHELRTPLNAILGYAELIRDQRLGRAGDSVYRAYAGDIHSAGKHLLDLINGLLDLSKIEAGRWQMDERPLDIRRIAQSIVRMQQLAAERAHIALSAEIPPDLPALQGDERAVTQILLNLVFNALKFTPAQGRVVISAARDAGGMRISVRDNGVGIAPELQERLFDRFTQSSDPLIRTDRGAGLGLSIVKGLIELHGGRITLASAPGQGTEVTLHFPPGRVLPDTVPAPTNVTAAQPELAATGT